MLALSILALIVAAVSLTVSIAAWSRVSRRAQLEGRRRDVEELARRVRRGYEELLARAERAQQKLAEMRKTASGDLRRRIDALRQQLAQAQRTAAADLAHLKMEVAAAAEAAEESLSKRVRRMEARLQLLWARMEMSNAEELAADGQFDAAEELLEDVAAKVGDLRARLNDMNNDEAFADVLDALEKAIRSVRMRAEDRKREMDRVVSASDMLLASLEMREQPLA